MKRKEIIKNLKDRINELNRKKSWYEALLKQMEEAEKKK
tara:strand:+ start:945 stop:1061 length:117 start_codon:yes stop_codon:yes gene_type:complete